MAKTYREGYQIDDLKNAVAALVAEVDGLAIAVDWTGDYETTFRWGSVPTVEYTVDEAGKADDEFHPAAVPVVALHLSQAIEEALGTSQNDKVRALIEKVHNCPVT